MKQIKPYLFSATFLNFVSSIASAEIKECEERLQNQKTFLSLVANAFLSSTAPAIFANLVDFLVTQKLTDDTLIQKSTGISISILLTPLAPAIIHSTQEKSHLDIYKSFLLDWDDKMYLKPHLVNSVLQFCIFNHLIKKDIAEYKGEEYPEIWFDKLVDWVM